MLAAGLFLASLAFNAPLRPLTNRALVLPPTSAPWRCAVTPRCRQPGGAADAQQAKAAKLIVSLLIDLVGFSSFLVPLAGDAADLAWAPVSALLVNYLYGNGLLTGLAFCEELLPGTDFIPTATIGWLLENTEFGQNFNTAASDREPGPFGGGSRRDFGRDGDGVVDVDGKPSSK